MPRTFVWHPHARAEDDAQACRRRPTGKVQIKQVRSGIGHSWRMRLTLEALGLRHHQAVGGPAGLAPRCAASSSKVRHLVDGDAREGVMNVATTERRRSDCTT